MNAVTAWAPPTRLNLPAPVAERFGIDAIKWKALVETIYPNATSIDSVVMALSYCEARKLDPFKRPVHIVPVWSKAANGMVDTVWPGISELRTTAMRTGLYAGKDKTEFGPDVTMTLANVEITFPEWAQTTVYRMVPGIGRCPFEGPRIYWIEAYATAKRDTKAPNDMWKKRPRGQLDKCSEAAALRTAFPEELGNEYAAEEVEGQAFGSVRDVTNQPAPNLAARLAAPSNGPREGFNTVHGSPLGDDDIPDFDAGTSPGAASEEPASDSSRGPRTDAGDDFPGDAPTTSREEQTAGPAEPNGDEGTGLAVDVLQRVDRVIADFEFKTLAELKETQADRRFVAFVAAIRAQSPEQAERVEKALAKTLESFG